MTFQGLRTAAERIDTVASGISARLASLRRSCRFALCAF